MIRPPVHPVRAGLCCASLLWLVSCRPTEAPAERSAAPARDTAEAWFVDRLDDSGIDFRYHSGAAGAMHLPEIMGGGVAIFDFDGDADLDIYLTDGGYNPVTGSPDPKRTNRMYRNDGSWRFADVTEESGLGDAGYAMGAVAGDADGDGDLDLYVMNYADDRLYLNDGRGRFSDATAASGIDTRGWSASATFLDYDRDGDLDLYVTQYLTYRPLEKCADLVGRQDFCGPQNSPSPPDILYRNEGEGRFVDVSEPSGIAAAEAPGLGIVGEDFDGNGWPDFYVANDGKANQLWLNQGGRRFEDAALRLGAAFNMNGKAEGGMGVVAEDFDRDGLTDLYMTHLREETNTLYRNLGGEAGFLDSTARFFPGAPSTARTGFGVLPIDIELDGDIDLIVLNGGVRGSTALSEFEAQSDLDPPMDRYAEPNQIYLNDGSGRFEELAEEACGFCSRLEISRGGALGDLDGDGDPDLVVVNIDSPIGLFENRAPREGAWLGVHARPAAGAAEDIGAVVSVVTDGRPQRRSVRLAHGYVSSSEGRLVFGLGQARRVDEVVVEWSDGARERFDADCVDCDVELLRGDGEEVQEP